MVNPFSKYVGMRQKQMFEKDLEFLDGQISALTNVLKAMPVVKDSNHVHNPNEERAENPERFAFEEIVPCIANTRRQMLSNLASMETVRDKLIEALRLVSEADAAATKALKS